MEAKKVYYFINGKEMDLTLNKEIAEQYKEHGLATYDDLIDFSCVGLWFREAVETVEGCFKWVEDVQTEICEYIQVL